MKPALNNLSDFATFLAHRAKVPPNRIVEFIAYSKSELSQETAIIEKIEHKLVSILNRSRHEPNLPGKLLHATDTRLYSRDYDWRSILSSLKEKGAEYNAFKLLALRKYLEYLRFRKQLLIYINVRRILPGHSPIIPQEQFLDTADVMNWHVNDPRDTLFIPRTGTG